MSDSLIMKEATVEYDQATGRVHIFPTGADRHVNLDRVEVGLLIRFLTQAHGVMQ